MVQFSCKYYYSGQMFEIISKGISLLIEKLLEFGLIWNGNEPTTSGYNCQMPQRDAKMRSYLMQCNPMRFNAIQCNSMRCGAMQTASCRFYIQTAIWWYTMQCDAMAFFGRLQVTSLAFYGKFLSILVAFILLRGSRKQSIFPVIIKPIHRNLLVPKETRH